MNDEAQIKLQAFLDGELPEGEAREMAALVARDPDAAALVTELKNTRQALAAFEPDLKLPESREFFWSKIEREIQRQQPAPAAPAPASGLMRLWRLLASAGAVAAVALVAIVASLHSGALGPVGAPDTEMTLANASTFTYQDDANGTTLVWVSFPAER